MRFSDQARLSVVALLMCLGVVLPAGVAVAVPETEGLEWRDCGFADPESGTQCADLPVPADWRRPDGERITIGTAKLPAKDPKTRQGSLLVNLGGPISTVRLLPDIAKQLGELTAWYDVILFDPRGIGASSEVRCGPAPSYSGLLYAVDRGTWREFSAAHRTWGDQCLTTAGPLAGQLDAWQVAHDLEAIRSALGPAGLNYYGNSYGTVYGQRYADLFPTRVHRMFLDSVADHTDPSVLRRIAPMAEIAQRKFDRFGEWCLSSTDCALHPRDPRRVFDALMIKAELNPLPAGPGKSVSADQLRLKALGAVDEESGWAGFAEAMAAAERGDAGGLWLPPPGQSPGSVANLAFCSDFPFSHGWPTTTHAIERPLREIAPRTGWLSARVWYGRCVGLPRQATNPPHPITADGAPPILLLNGEQDDTTPPAGGQNVARQLPGSVWFTADAGHAAYLSGNRCVRDVAHRYLITGRMPEAGHRCPAS
jgi:pimeloyl-ACP methyl ester carboxylesterase